MLTFISCFVNNVFSRSSPIVSSTVTINYEIDGLYENASKTFTFRSKANFHTEAGFTRAQKAVASLLVGTDQFDKEKYTNDLEFLDKKFWKANLYLLSRNDINSNTNKLESLLRTELGKISMAH